MMEPEVTTRTSLRDFFHVIFKRKKEILLFFTVTVCTVATVTLIVKPTYRATSQILVKLGRENLYMPSVPTSKSLNPVVNFNREEQINSEIEILKSQYLIEKVVQSIGPTAIYPEIDDKGTSVLDRLILGMHAGESSFDKAVLKLQKALEVEGVRKSDVIAVSFKHKDPQMAAVVVNTLVSLYLDRHLDVHNNPRSYNFFGAQAEILKGKLKSSEKKLEAFKKRETISSLGEERSLLLQEEAQLRSVLNETLSREAEYEHRLQQLHKQLANTPRTVLLDKEIDNNPYSISSLQARLVELELKKEELLTKYTRQSRLVQSVIVEIQIVRDKLAEQEKRLYGKTRSGLNAIHQTIQGQLLGNEAELQALRAKKQALTAQLVDYQRRLEKLNRVEVELNQLQHELDVDRENYRLYLTKFEESRISNAMDTEKMANVSLIESARAPLEPASPKVLLNLVLSVFLGGLGGLGLGFFLEYLDDSLEKTEDVEEYLKVPVLASIPEFKS